MNDIRKTFKEEAKQKKMIEKILPKKEKEQIEKTKSEYVRKWLWAMSFVYLAF